MKNRVLLIDDDALTYSKLNNILNVFENSFDFKIKLDYARTLSDATTLLKNKKYDLMILDYFMHENTTESFLFNTKEKYPNLKIEQDTLMNGKHKKIEHMWNFFDTLHDPKTKTYLGEDFAFCKRWNDIGGKCYAYILDKITHVGEHQYTGRFADELIHVDK